MYNKIKIQFGTPSVETAQESVFGRNDLAKQLWQTLEAGSVRLLSERRMGKTWLLVLAMATKPRWAIPLFFDAEGCSSTSEFILKLNGELHRSQLVDIKWWETIQDWFRRSAQHIQGKTIAGMEIPEIEPWSALLESTCRHLAEKAGDKKAVIIIDELPFFLDKLIKEKRGQDAICLLDHLRQLRQTINNLRFVFCGSLGLHLVLNALQREGYTGRPVNDMQSFDVPPLTDENARRLAGGLVIGENVTTDDLDSCAAAIAKAASGVPFYMQHIVKWMRDHDEKPWTAKRITHVPEIMFEEPGDPAEFSYYDSRLSQYYLEDVAERSRIALDMLSRNAKGLAIDELLNLVRHAPQTAMLDGGEFLRILEGLRDDHYLRLAQGKWSFKLEVVRRWWFAHRGGLTL